MSMLPDAPYIKLDFIIVGTQKGGTSALDYYLRKHKQITMSKKKEIHFFDNDANFTTGQPPYHLLNQYYPNGLKKGNYGEATPIYMYWDHCIERIHRYNPEVKLIAVLRNPVQRAYSHWNMEVSRGKEQRSFINCILDESKEIKTNSKTKHRVFSYLDRGLYAIQIEKMFSFFSEDQLLFLQYEDFLKSPLDTMNEVFSFLNLDVQDYKFQEKQINKFEYISQITEIEVNLLIEFFKEDIAKVEQLLQWDCSHWKT